MAVPKAPKPPAAPTVHEVINFLKQFAPTARVYLSRDSEGNGFSPLNLTNGVGIGRYESGGGWSAGDFAFDENNPLPATAEAIALFPLH